MGQDVIVLDQHSPTGIKGVDRVHLPEVYRQAKQQLAACRSIDETKEWGAKADALAAYARMMNDREIEDMASAVRKHAKQRYGELLLEAEKEEKPQGRPKKNSGAISRISPSEHEQRKQARQFARVPKPLFEKAVKAGKSDSAIAKMAPPVRAPRPSPEPTDIGSPESKEATKLINLIAVAQKERKKISVAKAALGMTAEEKSTLSGEIASLAKWLAELSTKL